jgi:hypothetical protein
MFKANACLEQGFMDNRIYGFEVTARSQLRDHTAVSAMHLDLGVDYIGKQGGAVRHDSSRGFIAGTFNTKNEHR